MSFILLELPSETGYSVTYIAKDGNNGNDGIAGKDGVGIKKTTITYTVGTSGTTAPTNGWNSQVPNVPAGQYLWTKTVWDYTDKTSETGYSVAMMGAKGDKGDRGIQGIQGVDGRQGIPGPKGADGKIQYAHIAYANSSDGNKDFSTYDSNRTYIGMCFNFKSDDSDNPSDYSWTLVKGADGTQGIPGKPGTDGKTPYFHTAWSYSADGTDGFTTVYPNLNLFTGTSDKPSTSTGGSWNIAVIGAYKTPKVGQEYTLSVEVPEADHDVMMEVFRWNNAGERVGTLYTKRIKSGGKAYITFTWPDPTDSGATQIAADLAWTNDTDTGTYSYCKSKLEIGNTATPHMLSASEVTTADYPRYIGQYTDFIQSDSANPSDYTWSLIRGNDGDPGKIVSDTEPSTRFKGLTWKYSGHSDLTASDGTVIHPNTEYYYNGTHWMINYLSANNLEANSITADLIDAKNLKITDGEFVSTIINGSVKTQTEIKDDHLLIYKTDTSSNYTNSITLKSDSGLLMSYLDSDTGKYTSVGVNFQGLFMKNDITNEFARLTPQGTELSTDLPWTKLSLMNNFTGNIEYSVINGTVYISAAGVGVPEMTAGQWKQAAQLPTGSSAIPIRENRIAAGDSGDGLSWAILSNQTGGIFIRCSANKAPTANLFNATLPYPIG